ncbi:ornithine cyclodeaminase family protein [Aquicoccus porphyridii]|uniref:Ornithine cyclodeaminase family protein n=1 Tax=Aquicoccus porphyridii TaxID=1852029 RepID=A0A5A9ZGC1_9RHOB|nr:NAD(P)-binding domain-containing protein [Aquicoccus porphyridii]KAA0916307.1 ornithine cyclodeaminase family protein [Aquicoccus porphyridii]RAI53566.1 ornithine cyclodeaminase family protein [Rhodobacteraceae bacterium AsT-22]
MTLPHLAPVELDALDITPDAACDAIETVIRAIDAGRATAAPKAMLTRPDGRYMMSTMAALDAPPLLVVKTMLQNPGGPAAGHRYIDGIVTVLDAASGQPLALIDGPWLTAHRTAALSGVAARRLAPPDARSLAILGAGVQAASHLAAMAELFPLEELRIVGRSPENAERLAATARARGLSARVLPDAQAAITDADIVVSAMSRDTAPGAQIDPRWLAPESFAALPDLGHHWMRAHLKALAPLLVDDIAQEQALPVASRLVPDPGPTGDLADLVLGRISPRPAGHASGLVFRGHAASDLALAWLVLQRAGLCD